MERRGFLQATAAVGAGAIFGGKAPAFIGAADKGGSKLPIVGSGEHTYECHHNWGALPDTMPFKMEWQTTHGVAVDPEGLVYITHQGLGGHRLVDTVVVFDQKGKYVRSFGSGFHPGGHGIDIRVENGQAFLYFCNVFSKAELVKTDLLGNVVWRMGAPEEAKVYDAKHRFSPTNLAFAPDGGFYVGDGYGSHYIHQYSADAKWVRTFGGPGKGKGQLSTPHGIWLDNRSGKEPTLVVADRANARLQYFSLDGKHLSFINDVLFPANIDIRGDVMLVPDLHARITLFDKDNKVIAHLGEDAAWRKKVLDGMKVRRDESQWVAGKFVHPHDACFDRDGNIYVAEWVETGRISFLKKVS